MEKPYPHVDQERCHAAHNAVRWPPVLHGSEEDDRLCSLSDTVSVNVSQPRSQGLTPLDQMVSSSEIGNNSPERHAPHPSARPSRQRRQSAARARHATRRRSSPAACSRSNGDAIGICVCHSTLLGVRCLPCYKMGLSNGHEAVKHSDGPTAGFDSRSRSTSTAGTCRHCQVW